MRKITWQGYHWLCKPIWGDTHPDDPNTWFDENLPYISEDDNSVKLGIKYEPKSFIDTDGNRIVKDWGKCLVRTINEFKYGTFEWIADVPYEKWYGTGLWLASDYSWPPEIDIMEGYSGKRGNYRKNLIFTDIIPTCHWSKDCDTEKEHLHKTKRNVLSCYFNKKGHDKYSVEWTPDYVCVRYNDKIVKTFREKELLEHLNKTDVKMHAKMSTQICDGWNMNDYNNAKDLEFKIYSFKYTPLC